MSHGGSWCQRFQRSYPDIDLFIYSSKRRVDLLEDGIDVELCLGDIRHEHLIARNLMSFRNVLVTSPTLVQRLGLPVTPQDLQRYPCAVWSSRMDAPACWELGGAALEPRTVLAANDHHMLTQRALYGDVVTELPPFLAAPGIRDGH